MQKNTHVYCTNCLWFKIINETPECKYSSECDFWDFEDSRPFSERPRYKAKSANKNYLKVKYDS